MSEVAERAVQNLRRRDARDKLMGRTRYTIDRGDRGMLHAALLRSDIASGKIRRLDVSRAAAMPGVRAIATAADAPGRAGLGIADHPLFATDIVRYCGEPIAAVAADTEAQAKAALAAIAVEIEPLPAVLGMAHALAEDAPLVHPDWPSYELLHAGGKRGGNVAWEASVDRGDVDAVFARDDVTIVETDFEVCRQNHVSFEPRATVAHFEDGRFHIESSTQVPWTVRNTTATVLGIPPSAVRVTVPPVGGGFGLKFDCALEPFAAILARKSGRPVRLVNSRREEMETCLFRENAQIRIRSAIAPDGTIAGREAVVLMDCGAYGGEQVFLTTMTAHTLGGNYKLGAARIVSRAVYTNTAPNGAFRACNGVYNTFALERHTDEIAARIGTAPDAFRRLNVIGDGDLGATGQVFEGEVLRPMMAKMETLRAQTPVAPLSDGRLHGRATTVGTWFVFTGPSAATVNMNADGSATLVTSGVEIGSGSTQQALPQIVAAILGLSPEQVTVRAADTDAAGYDVGVGGGRTTVSLGAASRTAALDVRTKLLKVASDMLEAASEDLVLADGRIEIAGAKGSGLSIAEVASHAQLHLGPIAGTGAFAAANTPAMAGCCAGHFIEALDIPVFAVHDCDIAVDPDTGHVEVLAYRVVQDVGKALNPRAIHGQVQGGVVQGLGYALHEEADVGPTGQIRQNSFETYRVPLAGDVVPVAIELHEGAPSIGPLGTKGAGEVPILNVGATIACAVANATGKAVHALPLTPPKVLALLLDSAPPPRFAHIKDRHIDNRLPPDF
ncbi:xanthine dehydrogenase family protein molybdopterin-binding subunit [Jiella sp. MQZ9-1]|uniref:Xanthine dehydrogenase family protein n=1 Tax=Jiella flava TaxID=2816857 RepID=A0A939JSM2_9HYPH|nr:xanthine dehydrogenase family protein molybdopterin-binding subunit [Jiella flava]MBO0663108.1 xanthine dehydrogenase family protein [Jiella flava]MCD2471527.1 xanthine dehydrogenase family protein molybdopterin-binding subunit [Jiella flava]